MKVGEAIRAARKKKGFTLKQMQHQLGLSHASISQFETGKTNPSRSTLINLARVLDDNFGLEWLDEYRVPIPSKKELANELSVEELIGLKFGGSSETRSRADIQALARMLDEAIAKEKRILDYPERKKKGK